ncbi:histidine kinase [Modestobacter sp. NPDC049651]|uniref:sensor histidine kinase n=1 Tax=unclassified Modestobacter TaxID=2643866 RepID=UPI0033D3115A
MRTSARFDRRDLVPALPLLALGLAATGRAAENQAGWLRAPDAAACTCIAVAGLALLLRRRAPRTCLVLVGAAVAAYLAQQYALGPVLLCGPAAAWAVAVARPWREALTWTAGLVLVPAVAATPAFAADGGGGWVGQLGWAAGWAAAVGGVGAIGAAREVRRRAEAGVRAEQARRAVSEERLQMAQDVHDGVGHGLAVIALHAGVALHVLDRDPARARELLTSIQATSREALDGLRADLDRWRGPDDAAARRPAPGVADLPQLLARMRAGGLALAADVDRCDDVPGPVGTAAHRIVQESLTNVLRHAGGATAAVRLRCAGGELSIEVRDDGGGPPGPAGSGITGMQRRAAAVGGWLTAGPAPGGGFVVRAALPLRSPAPVETP